MIATAVIIDIIYNFQMKQMQ